MENYKIKYLDFPERILEKTILINDSGFFFDYMLKEKDIKSIGNAKFDTEEIEIIAYPKYNQILENIDKLKKSRAIVLLYDAQKKEQDLLSTYFRKQKIEVIDTFLNDFLKSDLDIDDLRKTSENNYYNRIIYVFLKIRKEFKLNPSNLKYIDSKNLNLTFSRGDFEEHEIKYLLAKKYLGLSERFDLVSFFSLIYHELTGFKDDYIKVLLKIIENNYDPNKFRAEDVFSQEEIKKFEEKGPLHNYSDDLWTVCPPYI